MQIQIKENKIVQYIKEAKEELQKAVWPSKKQLINHTAIVIGVSLAIAVFIGIVDFLFTLGLEKIIPKQ